MLKPRFRFQNIKGVQSVNFVLSRGVQPSLCTVQIPYNPNIQLSQDPSDLFFSDGERSVAFSNCVVNDVSPTISESGEKVTQIGIHDRRWKWAFGQVSGEYNTKEILLSAAQLAELLAEKRKNQKSKKSRKADKIFGPMSLKDLCIGLLDEMGETGYDVSRVSDDTFPYVNWDLTVPSLALDELCQQNNLHVILNWRDKVEIWPYGSSDGVSSQGVPGLPSMPSSSASFGCSKGAVPDKVAVTTAPMLFQDDFKMIPLGKARDGKFYPIDKLPYIPTVEKTINGKKQLVKTWEYSKPGVFGDIPDETNRKLAVESVYLYYGIEVTPDPVFEGQVVQSIHQYDFKDFQLSVVLIEPTKEMYIDVVDGKQVIKERDIPPQIESVPQFAKAQPVRRKPEIFGKFYDEKGAENNNVKEFNFRNFVGPNDRNTDANKKLRYTKSFDFDNEKKMVKLDDPLFMLQEVETEVNKDTGKTEKVKSWLIKPADVYLRIAYAYKDYQSRAFYRQFKDQQIVSPLRNTPTAYVAREDIEPFKYFDPNTSKSLDNLDEVEDQLDYYLKTEAERWKSQQVANASYPMVIQTSPDGIRAQVVWSIGLRGIQTTVSVGEELITNMPKYEDRRKMQLLGRTLKMEQLAKSKPPETPKPNRINE